MSLDKIVTLFDTAQHAEDAKKSLINAGFASTDISLVDSTHLSSGGQAIREPGIWHRLFGHDVVEEDAKLYSKAIETGGVVLTLRTAKSRVDEALKIINAYQKVAVTAKACAAPKADPVSSASKAACAVEKNEVIRLAEEGIEVGKRQYVEGKTVVHRYVTTEKAEAQISLHEEHANIVRHAINNPACLCNVDWSDKVIEVTETNEKPVIAKTARIVEEIIVGKEGSDRTETVTDTIRKQHVDIERIKDNNVDKSISRTTNC